jgi:3-hydroxymyristoyl/3-hydroxydecanoyl-(acyl carrier protein) dehydratase
MNPYDYDILDLIPQRPPLQMIDKLLYADERMAKGSLLITDNNLFCENKIFRESGLIEFIAQTAAAFTGYRNKCNSNMVKEGYIGAIKNLEIFELPPASASIQSEILVENEIVGFTIVSGKVYFEERCIATCEMRILGA